METEIKKSLDGIYQFMSQAYLGNWQYRFAQTPYLEQHIKEGKNESIPGHQWACIGFWFYLRRACSALDSLVNSAEIYERLWGHDLGETFEGDVSQFLQVAGKGGNKHEIERREIEKMGQQIPKNILGQLLSWFDEYEEDINKINKLEVLVGKFIDTIQGDHYALLFGKDLSDHSQVINKIISRTFVPITQRLLEVLESREDKRAYKEIQEVAAHHVEFIRKTGVKLNIPQLGLDQFL